MNKKLKKFIIPPVIVILGIVIMGAMVATKKKPTRQAPMVTGALVNVMTAHQEDRNVVVTGTGTVKAKREIQLSAQVAGKVESVHQNFAVGGRFRAGQELFRIEAKDYQLAVDRAEAQVAQAEYGLAVAKANAEIAKEEWEMMQASAEALALKPTGKQATPGALVLHVPQLKQAEAGLASAEAALETAKLALSRTVVTAPFNCLIRSESVDPGQTVGPGVPVARLISTDVAEIDIGLQEADLRWLKIPGSEAVVKLKLGGEVYKWQGSVERQLGFIEEMGRLAHVIVEVKRPLDTEVNGRTLNVGSFVEVDMMGLTVPSIYPVPRRALHSNSTIWVVKSDSTLEIRSVEIEYNTTEEVMIANGLQEGEMVVLTNLSGAANGMKLRPVEKELQ
ncbi:efflux RND transporter periplasmic adaptor subunit [Calditrichota bacterium]